MNKSWGMHFEFWAQRSRWGSALALPSVTQHLRAAWSGFYGVIHCFLNERFEFNVAELNFVTIFDCYQTAASNSVNILLPDPKCTTRTSLVICAFAIFSQEMQWRERICDTSREIRALTNFSREMKWRENVCDASREIRALINFSIKMKWRENICDTSREILRFRVFISM